MSNVWKPIKAETSINKQIIEDTEVSVDIDIKDKLARKTVDDIFAQLRNIEKKHKDGLCVDVADKVADLIEIFVKSDAYQKKQSIELFNKMNESYKSVLGSYKSALDDFEGAIQHIEVVQKAYFELREENKQLREENTRLQGNTEFWED